MSNKQNSFLLMKGGSLSWLCILALTLTLISSVQAAEPTVVADAAEENNPFDFIGEVFYRRHLRRSKITREYNCNPSINPEDAMTCPGAPAQGQIIHVKELRYARYTHEVVPRARFGLYRDLELWIEAPIVIEDTQEVRFAGNGGDPTKTAVNSSISSVSPEGPTQKLFTVPDGGFMDGLPRRAGFGDMLFKLRYAPISSERDDTRGEWVIEAGYRAPTGSEMRPSTGSSGGVGRGVHELVLGTSFSKRFEYVEPYARFSANLPLGSSLNSPFKRYTGSQEFYLPGAKGGFDFGVELIPFENPKEHVKVFIDLGLGVAYQAEGRDYSELFDAFAAGAISCNDTLPARDGRDNCAFYNPNARDPSFPSQAPSTFDGITTVEQFMTVRAHLGLGVYASEYFKIGADLAFAHETEHNLTNADIGEDLLNIGDERGVFVPANNVQQRSEHNPTYVPNLDALGRRVRVEETTLFTISAYIGLLF